jgi:hypothetical protein
MHGSSSEEIPERLAILLLPNNSGRLSQALFKEQGAVRSPISGY